MQSRSMGRCSGYGLISTTSFGQRSDLGWDSRCCSFSRYRSGSSNRPWPTFLIFSAATIVAGENHENAKFLLISWNLNFTSNTTADGTSTIAGAFADEGTRHEDFTVSVQGDRATVTGTIIIHATHGDLTESFVGTIPLGPNHSMSGFQVRASTSSGLDAASLNRSPRIALTSANVRSIENVYVYREDTPPELFRRLQVLIDGEGPPAHTPGIFGEEESGG